MSDALGIAQPQRVNLAQMLSGRYFIIPDYQRHYAWTEKQCLELFEDCVLTARNPGRERFMSTITTIAPTGNSIFKTYTDSGYTQLKPLLVVDGQQRLTSLLILISCICRQLLLEDATDSAARNAYANFVSTPLSDGLVLLRVIPQSIPSHPDLMSRFLRQQITLGSDDEGGDLPILIPAQRRLRKARETFEGGLRELTRLPQDEQVSLKELLTCVASRLIFILNTLSDVGQAGEVFEGLNNRGLGLSALENLKSFSIYAVQSFRRGEDLPSPMRRKASELNDDLNDAIGDIYHHLDKVALPDDTAKDLLCAFWPLVVTRVSEAGLGKDDKHAASLDRALPVDDIRECLHIQNARSEQQQAKLLETLRFMICDKLVPASEFFADARRPSHPSAFERVNLPPDEMKELKGLHQRLVEMQCSAAFMPLIIAHRAMQPGNTDDYVALLRLIERVAFWVYVLGDSNRGKGQKELARIARQFIDAEVDFSGMLLALRSFALSLGATTDSDMNDEDEYLDLARRVDQHLTGQKQSVWAAFAYEWLLHQKVELPSYSKFVGLVEADKCLRLVPATRGKLPSDYELTRADMYHPGNIVITRKMGSRTTAERNEFNARGYVEKRVELKNIGYSVSLPYSALTKEWAEKQRAAIRRLAIARWSIPEDGRILEATWSSHVEQEFEGDGDRPDA